MDTLTQGIASVLETEVSYTSVLETTLGYLTGFAVVWLGWGPVLFVHGWVDAEIRCHIIQGSVCRIWTLIQASSKFWELRWWRACIPCLKESTEVNGPLCYARGMPGWWSGQQKQLWKEQFGKASLNDGTPELSPEKLKLTKQRSKQCRKQEQQDLNLRVTSPGAYLHNYKQGHLLGTQQLPTPVGVLLVSPKSWCFTR